MNNTKDSERNMKKSRIQIIGLSFFILVFIAAGCSEIINDIPLDSAAPRLVVEGYISTDTARQVVKLSKLGDALMKEPIQPVSDALITISDGTTTYNLTEDKTVKGTYYTTPDAFGVVGHNYTLSITNVDINNDQVKEEYTAQSAIKRLNPIDSIHLVYNSINPDFKGWSVNLYALDPDEGRNFYLIKILRNNKLLTDSIFKYSVNDNWGFEGKYFDGFQVYFLEEKREEEKLLPGDTVTVEMFGIDENYYSFIRSYITDYYPKVPIFSGPSANIPTNIKPYDNAVGIFAAYSIERKSTIYK
jgi:hypothetical protein